MNEGNVDMTTLYYYKLLVINCFGLSCLVLVNKGCHFKGFNIGVG